MEFLTRKELCEVLKVDRHTVYNWIKEGMPYHPLNKHKRFVLSEVLEYFRLKSF